MIEIREREKAVSGGLTGDPCEWGERKEGGTLSKRTLILKAGEHWPTLWAP